MKLLFRIFGLFCIISLFSLSCSSGSGKRKEEASLRQETIRELKYGRLLANKILKKFPVLKDEKINRYINSVGKSVAIFAGRSDIDYYFTVLDTDNINAYATPGGYVFISRGALLMMKNESELAGVLAHEIGHINNRHIMKDLPPPRKTGGFIDTLSSLLVAQGAAVSSAFTEVVNKAADVLFTKGYRVEDEYEADKSGIIYAYETGYYPLGLLDFIERIWKFKQSKSESVVYNTHPPFETRITALKLAIESEGMKTNRPKVMGRFLSETKHLE